MSPLKTILVTGASGLIGQALQNLERHYPDYYFVFSNSKQCDLSDYDTTLQYFKKVKPNIVIHLAAYVGGLFKNMNYKVDMLEKNLLINYNVVKASYLCNVENLVCTLSTCIFPDKTSYPIDENMLHNGPPHFSNDAYAYAKRMMEVHCKAYNEQYNTNFNCIIPCNVYGPNDNYSLEDGHVIPALIHKCYLAKKEGKPFEIRGTGKPLRQFIYSHDLAKLIMETFPHLYQENIILSNDYECPIREVALQIAKEFDYVEHAIFNSSFADGQYKKTADITKLRKILPNFKFTSIEEGIHNSVEYFKTNYEYSRR